MKEQLWQQLTFSEEGVQSQSGKPFYFFSYLSFSLS